MANRTEQTSSSNDTPHANGGGRAETSPMRPRFSWLMRIFLICFLFDMFARSIIQLTPAEDEWADELSVDANPLSLPSPKELRQCSAGTHPDGYDSPMTRWSASLQSVARFFVPYPQQETREKIDSVGDVGKYSLAWISSRLDFIGRMVGVDQDWPMFSPNVGDDETVGRLRLVYEDGSEQDVRLLCDPTDLTSYSHWFQEKHLQVVCKVHRDTDTRVGYCHMLSRREPHNENGSPLVRIQVFKVHYEYPSPSDDAFEFLTKQSGPPADQIDPPFWEYDVASGKGHWLD